jgi:hypothetical protein
MEICRVEKEKKKNCLNPKPVYSMETFRLWGSIGERQQSGEKSKEWPRAKKSPGPTQVKLKSEG